jgi:hypothetical protein
MKVTRRRPVRQGPAAPSGLGAALGYVIASPGTGNYKYG